MALYYRVVLFESGSTIYQAGIVKATAVWVGKPTYGPVLDGLGQPIDGKGGLTDVSLSK